MTLVRESMRHPYCLQCDPECRQSRRERPYDWVSRSCSRRGHRRSRFQPCHPEGSGCQRSGHGVEGSYNLPRPVPASRSCDYTLV